MNEKPVADIRESAELRAIGSDRDWHGYLTIENFEAVAGRIRRLLEGRSWTWVACNEGLRGYFPEVRTGQRLRGSAVTAKLLAPGHGHITVVDSYGVWGLSAHLPDQAAARALSYDEACAAGAHLSFERAMGSRPDRLEIEHFAPAGARLYWVAAVEPAQDDDDG